MDELIHKLKNDVNWVAFVEFIEAPADFYSLSSVVNNFIKINSVRSKIQIEEMDFLHAAFNQHIQTAIEINDFFSRELTYPVKYRQMSPQGSTRRDNLIGENPLYAALTDTSTISAEGHKNLWCEYYFLMMGAVLGYKTKVKNGEIKHSSLNWMVGLRGVRKLESLSSELPKDIPLPSQHLKLEDLIIECDSYLERQSYEWLTEVITMLKTFEANKEGYTRRYRSKIERIKKIEEYSFSDDEFSKENVTKLNDILNDKSAQKVHSRGMAAAEFSTSEGIHENNHSKPYTVVSNRQTYKAMSGKRNAIIHATQRLYYKQNTLNPREAYVAILALTKGELQHELNELFGVETTCMFGLLIFTGRRISNLSTLRWQEKKPSNTGKHEFSWHLKEKHLSIPTKVVDKHNKLDESAKAYISFACGTPILERREFYEVNVPKFLSELLMRHYDSWKLKYKKKRLSKNDARTIAFTDVKRVEENIAELIKHLNNRFNLQLSLRKIIRFFEQSFMKVSDDQAEYVFITGERINHGVVSAHYYYIKPSNLNTTHTLVINQILAYAGYSAQNSPIQASLNLHESQNNYALGSKLVMNSVLMQKYVKSIKQTVKDVERNGELAEKHNHFVFYCIKLLAYATGYRAVGDPFDHISQLDRNLGLMVISDKDYDDHFHTRIVPVSKLVIDQFDFYEAYLQKLQGYLGSHPVLLSEIRLLLNHEKSKLPYLFFLSEKMRVISISPEHIKKYIRFNWSLPANINRHYLRSEIMELSKSSSQFKVSCECLDYFMGHWETGEEPFNKHAMVSPLQIKKEIQPIIDHILVRDGWSPMKGPVL